MTPPRSEITPGVSLDHATVQALRPACGRVTFWVTCTAESPGPYPMLSTAFAPATASSSLICPRTVRVKLAVSLAAWEEIVAVSVTCALPIEGRRTVPSSAIRASLFDDQLILQLSLPLVGRLRFPATLAAESPSE